MRAGVIAGRELGAQLRSALPWVLIALVGLTLVSMNPTALIPSGGSLEPGEQLWRNSKFAAAQGFAWTSFFLYNFFAAIMAGFCVLRDEENGVSELLYATPLTSREYLVGKLAGVLTALAIVLTAHLLIAAGLSQFGPEALSAAQNGPFRWSNFLTPALAFAVPGIWFSAGLGFAAGVRTRQPIAVLAVPTTIFLVTVYVFNAWPLTGLDGVTERWLMILDPSGLRWLAQTAFGVDRGATFYNTAPLGLDATFWLCRTWAIALPFAAVWLAARYHRRTSAGARGRSTGIGRLWWRSASPVIANGGSAFGPLSDGGSFGSLALLRMSSVPPAWGANWRTAFVAELREFRSQPGLYLFVVLIVAAVAEFATEPGGDGAGSIPSTGELAVGTLEVVTFLCCLLLLVLLVEALSRERRTGLDSIVDALPFRGAEILWGKGLAAAVVVALALLASSVTGLALLEIESPGDLEIRPILWVWGLLVSTSLLVWGAAVIAVWSIVRDRAATYAIGLLALAASAGVAASGASTWLTNWTLAGALRWSDIAPFELYREGLWLNRLLVLLSALTLALVASHAYSRRELDVVARRARRRRWLAPSRLWIVPPAVAALAVAGTLWWRIHDGFQGAASRERAREYWQSNAATWAGVESPIVTHLDLRVDLDPDHGSAAISGAYRMTNRTARAMRRVAFTTLPALDRVAVEWTVDDVRTRAQERSGLYVLHLAEEWIPGEQRHVGFAYEARFPRGLTRNGGELEQFVLPSGVVLHTLRDSFLPQPGFVPEVGGAGHGFLEGRADPGPAVGPAVAFTTRLEVSAPSDFLVNSVGERARETTSAGRTTVVWASDEPVRAINIVAGRWSVLRRDGAAVFHHVAHADGAQEVLDALASAFARFSEWFHPLPWKELRLSEFPNTVSNAQGFPSNISFSEGLGFGANARPGIGEGYIVTAHEAAHQWWGNLFTPADAPGADVLIEGLAHYSTLLLLESERGAAARIDFLRRLEQRYLTGRRIDSEPTLAEVGVGSRIGEESVALDKGAWALWMLDRHLGRERMLAGLRALIARHRAVPATAFATLVDFIEALRPLARDSEAYDNFVEQWFYEIVTPRFIARDAISTPVADGSWRVIATVVNVGTGNVSVEVATAGDGDRLSSPTTVTLEAGTQKRLEWVVAFEPRRIVVDPGVHVLQTDRARAWAPVIAASPLN